MHIFQQTFLSRKTSDTEKIRKPIIELSGPITFDTI